MSARPAHVRPPIHAAHAASNKRPPEHRAARPAAARTVRTAVRELQRTAGNDALRHVVGAPLDADARVVEEERLGADLGHVRLYADRDASSRASSLGAAAFAHGPAIFFAAGMYRPETEAGRIVLAHELAHVVQQTRNTASTGLGTAALEAEADAAAVGGEPVVGSAPAGATQTLSDDEEEERVRQARAAFPVASDRPVAAHLVPSPNVLRPSPFDVPPTPEPAKPERTAAAKPPGPGTFGDVAAALVKVPAIKRLIDQEGQKFEGLPTGEKVLLGSVLTPLAAGAIAGIATDKAAREAFDGAELPVPKLPWLSLKVFTKGGPGGMIQVDVWRLVTETTRNTASTRLGTAALEPEADAAAVGGEPVVGSAEPGSAQTLSDDEKERVRQARAAFPVASDRPVAAHLVPSPNVLRPSPFDVPPTPEPAKPERTAAAKPPRPGTFGDVAAALVKVPAIKRLIDQEGQKFEGVPTGEKVVLGSVLTPLAAGAIAGIATDKAAREAFDGAELPVPKLPWLSLKVFTKGGPGGMIRVDVWKLVTEKQPGEKKR